MTKQRLDKLMAIRGLTRTRSEAESWIRLGRVRVNGRVVAKAGEFVAEDADLQLDAPERYVSRAGLKLASVADRFGLRFEDTCVLDVGSSTGGFTDFALQHGACKVIAVDVGTDQLHPSLRGDQRIELHEKTDIRGFVPSEVPNIVVIDVSFVSLRQILPSLVGMIDRRTLVVAMVKPQFEADRAQLLGSGIVRNDRVRRDILKAFEMWAKSAWTITQKADSDIKGAHGNQERFYVLKKIV